MRAGPIYENRVFVDADTADDYDAWIAARLTEAAGLPGIAELHTFVLAADAGGRPGRAAQFTFEDDASLEEFVDGFATDLEAEAIDFFGEAIDWLSASCAKM